MSKINDRNIVQKQYENANNLNTRCSIHEKYSVNKQGFGNWIVSNYVICEGMRVLELGCGTADMWKEHKDIMEKCSELILTDFSEGMIKAAQANLGELDHVSYQVFDIQDIPFEEDSFDVVIANMMLYHVPDLGKGLAEVRRVLKPNGKFYCATYGEHGIIEYISGLLSPYGVEDHVNKNFTLQNGCGLLKKQFESVQKLEYIDSLEVTDIEDMVEYIFSLTSMTTLSSAESDNIKSILALNMKNGVLKVPKEYGMFIAE